MYANILPLPRSILSRRFLCGSDKPGKAVMTVYQSGQKRPLGAQTTQLDQMKARPSPWSPPSRQRNRSSLQWQDGALSPDSQGRRTRKPWSPQQDEKGSEVGQRAKAERLTNKIHKLGLPTVGQRAGDMVVSLQWLESLWRRGFDFSPGQRVKDSALLQLWHRLQFWLRFNPWPRKFYAIGAAEKQTKKRKQRRIPNK